MANEAKKPVIGVDFDGTICEEAYPKIGALKPGVKEALTMIRALGYKIVIWTCRTCSYDFDIYGGDPKEPTLERERVVEMKNWLIANRVPFDEIDDGSRGKLSAVFYIDDRGIRFENNWDQIVFWLHQKQMQDKAAALQRLQQQQTAAQVQGVSRGA